MSSIRYLTVFEDTLILLFLLHPLILVTFPFHLTPYPLFLHVGLSSILLSNAKLFHPRGDVYVLPSQCPGPSCEEVPLVEEVPHRDATGETHAQSYLGGEGWVCAITWCHTMYLSCENWPGPKLVQSLTRFACQNWSRCPPPLAL